MALVTAKKQPSGRKQKSERATVAARSAGDRLTLRPGGEPLDRLLFDRFQRYIADLYNPRDSSGELAPSIYPHQGAARRKPFDIPYTSTLSGEKVIFKMYPRGSATLSASVGGSVPTPSNNNTVAIDFEGMVDANQTVGGAGRNELIFGGIEGARDFELPSAVETVSAEFVNAVSVATPAAAIVSLVFINHGSESAQVRVYYYDPVALAWVAATGYVAVGGGATLSTSVTPANGATRYAVMYRNGSAETRSVKITTLLNVRASSGWASATLTFPTGGAYRTVAAYPSAQAIDEDRVVAMNMTLTCMGDMTTTAGRVAAALVPRFWTPDPVDPVGSIAALPTCAGDYKLIDGADVIWQPRAMQDFTFSSPEIDDDSYYLVIAAELAHPDTPIRLRASYNYEIFSLDPALGSMAWCPSGFGLMEVLHAVFSAVPPVSTNDGHFKKAKRAVKAVAALARKGVEWVVRNPGEAAALAAKASAMLL